MNQQIFTVVVFVCVSFIAIALLMLIRELLGNGRLKILDRLGFVQGSSGGRLKVQERPISQSNGWSLSAWLQHMFVRAGLFSREPSSGLWLIAGALVSVGGMTFVLLNNPWIAIGTGGFAFVVIVTVLYFLGSRRQNLIREQLPNAMDLLSRALRAGESVDQAVALAAKSCPTPISGEFRRCARQLEMGLSLSNSMDGFVRRVPIVEMRIMASSIALQKRAGGSLSRTLERLARVFRDRLQFYRRYRTVTAASRLSILVISLVAPSVFLYLFIWQSDYVEPLLSTVNGQRLLILDVCLMIVGLVWSFRLLQAEK